MDQFERKPFFVKKLIVHAGIFHADDVFCAAMMRLINPNVMIERVMSSEADLTDLVQGIVMADIGNGIFDHHQMDTPLRYDGIRHCAASRLWLYCGMHIVESVKSGLPEEKKESICGRLYDGVIRTIAIIDNGIPCNDNKLFTINCVINSFLPAWNELRTLEECFADAVDEAIRILRRELIQSIAEVEAEDIVEHALSNMKDGIIELDVSVPWEGPACKRDDVVICIFPGRRGDVNLQLVPTEARSFITRIHVPDAWRGKRGAEAESQMPGMTFCHASGFLSCFKSWEQARKAAEYLVLIN